MHSARCPPADQLTGYVMGTLPPASAEQIADHVEACPACDDTVTSLEALDDTVLQKLRQPAPKDSLDDELACDQAVRLVQAIGQDPSFTSVSNPLDERLDAAAELDAIGAYQLLDKLGEGGMGAVYKALHTKLNKVVAIKVLPAEKMKDPQAVARFEREMRAVGTLEHPNIVRAMDAGEVEGMHFLVMEYVKGRDLSQISKQLGPLPVAEACELVRQAAIGLDEAHDHDMVHRDIKPSNLILAERRKKAPVVKILDMGLALLSDAHSQDRDELTSTGQMMGTLDYMAPEQGGDSKSVDIRADIYALGATLYRLLCGRAIYYGRQYQTPVQKLMALATEPAPPIQSRCEGIPDPLAAIVHRMLSKDPAARFATPQEVADALAPYCDGADLSRLLTEDALRERSADAALSATDVGVSSSEVDTEVTEALDRSGSAAGKVLPAEPPATVTRGDEAPSQSPPAKPKPAVVRETPAALLIGGGAGLLGVAAVLAAIVIYFQTPYGTLRVEIEDPKIEVRVKGEDIVLTNADKEPIRIKAGKQTLVVTRGDDFSFETKLLILKKSGTTTVKVEMLPGKVQVVSAGTTIGSHPLAEARDPSQPVPGNRAPPLRPDRHAAEWVRSINSHHFTYIVIRQNGEERRIGHEELKSDNALPEAFQLTGVNLQYNRDLTDEGLANLKDCRNLTYFQATYTAIRDEGLAHLKACAPALQELHLPGGVTDVGLANFAECRELTRLTLQGVKATTTGLDNFRHCKKLTSLSLGGVRLEGESLAGFSGCTDLEHLNVRNTALAPAELAHFKGCTKLKTVDLSGNPEISNQGIGFLKNCRDLTSLNLAYADVDDEALSFLSQCRQLSYLNVANTSVSEAFLESLQEKLPDCKIDRNPKWPSPARRVPQLAVAPFDFEQAKRHQQAWAEHLGVPVEKEIVVGKDTAGKEVTLTMVLIPPGEFKMGASRDELSRVAPESASDKAQWLEAQFQFQGPQHKVRITEPFYLGKHEVTQAQWECVTGANPSEFKREPSYPVERVNWDACHGMLARLNETSAGVLRFALPTEAQWEYACRAGAGGMWCFGDDEARLREFAHYGANSNSTSPVGQLQPNSFGLHDVHGNVSEWCADMCAPGYYAVSPVDNPAGGFKGSAFKRTVRGGSWQAAAGDCRSAFRGPMRPAALLNHVGLRLAASIKSLSTKPGPNDDTPNDDTPDTHIEITRAGDWSEPVNLGPVINSKSNEGGPMLSADGLILLFDSNREASQLPDVWMSTRASIDEPWSQPVKVAGDRIKLHSPTLSSDGLELLCVRDVTVSSLNGLRREAVQDPWPEPVQLRSVSSKLGEGGPTLSTDGLTLIYHRYQDPGGEGLSDLFQSTRRSRTDSWSTPVSLGRTINWGDHDRNPSLSADGLSLAFESIRMGNHGSGRQGDIWLSTRVSPDAPWKKPVNLGPRINGPGNETDPALSADGRTLIFSAERPGGEGSYDLWMSTRTDR